MSDAAATPTVLPSPAPAVTISASRLKVIGGEKGAPGCERRYAGQYLFGLKQSETAALERGSALHALAEHYQLTGELLHPESELGALLASGAHLITMCGKLLVEHEHIGVLPDGTPYVAYLDGHSERALHGTGTIIIQDLKTTGNARFALQGADQAELDATDASPEDRALVATRTGPYALRLDIQAILYSWILLCAPPHWYAPTLPDGVQGPRHWQWWDPKERGARVARLRWIYFLTKGNPRAWEETDFVLPAQAEASLHAVIMPLVVKINNMHRWHAAAVAAGRTPSLDEIDRTPAACDNRGRWCGVFERDACAFDQLGTPINELIQLKVRATKMTPQERLAQIRKNAATRAATGAPVPAPAAAAPVQEAPAASPPAPTAEPAIAHAEAAPASIVAPSVAPDTATAQAVTAQPAIESTATTPAAEPTRGQKAAATRAARRAQAAATPATPTAPPGAGINPPEVTEALAKLAQDATATPAAAPAPARPSPALVAVVGFPVEQIVEFLISHGYTVQAPAAAASAGAVAAGGAQ